MVKVKIHRGTHQIGGCATEINCNGERIIIDLGANLVGTELEKSMSDLELLESVFENNNDTPVKAVLFSHYHGDHIGLYKDIPDDIPLYIGETAKDILLDICIYTDKNSSKPGAEKIKKMNTYVPGSPIPGLQNMKITPFYVDHSAIDAYMFLIEAEEKRILFTGDFREHGIANEREQLWSVIDTYIGEKIDLLITEGTMLSRTKEEKNNTILTEAALGQKAKIIFEEKPYNFVIVSSTNFDSIMEFYQNTPKEKLFVCDTYQARLLLRVMEHKGKQYPQYRPVLEDKFHTKWIHIIGFVPYFIINMLNSRGKALQKTLKHPLFFKTIKQEELHEKLDNGFVMLIRPNHNKEQNDQSLFEQILEEYRTKYTKDIQIIYSLWEGYLKGKTKDSSLVDLIGDTHYIPLHTSGHAYVKTIAKLLDKTKPRLIIPMHSEMTDSFSKFKEFEIYKDVVRCLQDGEILEV